MVYDQHMQKPEEAWHRLTNSSGETLQRRRRNRWKETKHFFGQLTASADSSVSDLRSSTLWSTALTAQKELAAASMTKLTLAAERICFWENCNRTWNVPGRCWYGNPYCSGVPWISVWMEGKKESRRLFCYSTDILLERDAWSPLPLLSRAPL